MLWFASRPSTVKPTSKTAQRTRANDLGEPESTGGAMAARGALWVVGAVGPSRPAFAQAFATHPGQAPNPPRDKLGRKKRRRQASAGVPKRRSTSGPRTPDDWKSKAPPAGRAARSCCGSHLETCFS